MPLHYVCLLNGLQEDIKSYVKTLAESKLGPLHGLPATVAESPNQPWDLPYIFSLSAQNSKSYGILEEKNRLFAESSREAPRDEMFSRETFGVQFQNMQRWAHKKAPETMTGSNSVPFSMLLYTLSRTHESAKVWVYLGANSCRTSATSLELAILHSFARSISTGQGLLSWRRLHNGRSTRGSGAVQEHS